MIIFALITSVWNGGALEIMTWCIFNKVTETTNGSDYPTVFVHLCTEDLCKTDLHMSSVLLAANRKLKSDIKQLSERGRGQC